MLEGALEIETHWTYDSWCTRTADYYKFKCLLWNGLPPLPHWLPAAQGDFRTVTAKTPTSTSEDSDDAPPTRTAKKTTRATSSSTTANEDSNLVQQALAQALLALTAKK